jgi:hypothetical protein
MSFNANHPPENTWTFVDLVFFEGYILDPKMVGALPGSTPTKVII